MTEELKYTKCDEEGIAYYIPSGSFEVDGIIYIPPWLEDSPEYSVNYQPMIEIKQEYYCSPEYFEDL